VAKEILQMKRITKSFPGVRALDDVSFSVLEHHIHALVGENGAGKSTLMNVLSGIYRYGTYSGDIIFNNKVCKFKNISGSEKEGIVIIHQELALIPYLSIAENVFLGNECANYGSINWNKTHRQTADLLNKVGLSINTSIRIKDIGVGKQQLVEIAKALSKDVKLLILDEPTAALNDEEADKLLELLVRLKNEGITSIIISHKLNEVLKVADEITVIRDGATIETLVKGVDDITEDRIIKGMVGRDIKHRFPQREPKIDYQELFEVRNWVVHDPIDTEKIVINNVNITIKKGEIVGLAGLMGAGRTEFSKSVFGKSYGSRISGEIYKNGKKIRTNSIGDSIKNGLAYVTEDRKTEGLVMIHDIQMNLTLTNLKKVSRYQVINNNVEIRECERLRESFRIKTPSLRQTVGNLSGGNQQKVALGKWIFSEPDVLLLDEPTRGIDVGAKFEIYSIINNLADQGKYILFISSELTELLGMCDRIYIMNEGRIVGMVDKKDASQETIMKCIIDSGKE
jgi:putative multiple sugar transport system ATP-binding protein